jgi:RNA polymerase sigma-70 factor (ECF subfamily)
MTSRADMTDHELLHAYATSRDQDSFGAFIGRYQGSLLRFAGKLLGDADGAQDVVQEAFLQVARDPKRLLAVESCHNWLLKVTRNIGISHLRRRSREARRIEATAGRVAGEAAEREEAERAALEAEEARARVRAEIDGLAPRHRELVLLKVVEKKSYREIAEITGLTVTNVGYLLHMAVKELSRRLRASKEDFT